MIFLQGCETTSNLDPDVDLRYPDVVDVCPQFPAIDNPSSESLRQHYTVLKNGKPEIDKTDPIWAWLDKLGNLKAKLEKCHAT